MAYAIEVKASAAVHGGPLKGLRQLAVDHPKAKRRFVVSLDRQPRRTDDGIEILPYSTLAQRLWAGELLR